MDEEFRVTDKILTKKHIAERQRRARINSYLEEIQGITHANNKGQKVKLEKAEVLETALSYLQNNPISEANNNTIHIDTDVQDLQSYEEGYRSCMSGILDGLEEIGLSDQIVPGLSNHLESFLERTLSHWTSETTQHNTTESDMAFSPSLAKLEQCLHKFETGNGRGSDVLKGSDVLSDISQSDAGSGTDGAQNTVPTTQNQEYAVFQNNSDLLSGYTVNEWVNMQREYVLHQQILLQQQQQQYQLYNQQQYQVYPVNHHGQTQIAEDLSVTSNNNNKNVTKPIVMSDVKEIVQKTKQGQVKQENRQTPKNDNTQVQSQVWRPW